MKERGLLLTDDSVRGILRSVALKTQTRRVVKLPHNNSLGVWEPTTVGGPNGGRTAAGETIPEQGAIWHTRTGDCLMSPYGGPSDHLWGRETFFAYGRWETRYNTAKGRDEWHFIDMTVECDRIYQYAADSPDVPLAKNRGGALPGWYKRPALFMPRLASRITLEITGVRTERLQDISEADAIAEGIEPFVTDDPDLQGMWRDYSEPGMASGNPIGSYMTLWNELNAARGHGWDTNPWVWVLQFRRLEKSGEASC